MTSTHDLNCELLVENALSVSCALPNPTFIEIAAGLGSALGTLIAASAAVFGVWDAYRQRKRADFLERKNTLRVAGEQYFQALNNAAKASAKKRYAEIGPVFRALFDLSNLLKDGDKYEKRLADALSVVTAPVVNQLLDHLSKKQGDKVGDAIYGNLNILQARGTIETLCEQSRSALNVVLNVTSDDTKEEQISFFEKRAKSLASQISERRLKQEK